MSRSLNTSVPSDTEYRKYQNTKPKGTNLSNIDPFDAIADDSVGEPFEDTPPAPKKAAVKKAPVADIAVDASGRCDITLKGGGAFDVPWIPLGFSSIDAAHAAMTDPETKRKLAELFDVTAKANALFVQKVAAVQPQKANSAGGAPARPGAEAPAGTEAAPGPDWTYKTGVNANTGKTWKAWMPPRGSDAKPVWL